MDLAYAMDIQYTISNNIVNIFKAADYTVYWPKLLHHPGFFIGSGLGCFKVMVNPNANPHDWLGLSLTLTLTLWKKIFWPVLYIRANAAAEKWYIRYISTALSHQTTTAPSGVYELPLPIKSKSQK